MLRMRRVIAVLAISLSMALGALPAGGATYVVSPNTFLVPGQSVQGYWDDGAPVALGRVYNTKLVVMGGTLTAKMPHYRWTLLRVQDRSMPDLRVNPNTGVVYGAGPTIAAGSHQVWVRVKDAAGRTITFWFLLELRQCNSSAGPFDAGFSPCPELSYSAYNTNRSGYLRPGRKGVEYNTALFVVAGQSPYRFVLGDGRLPAGMSLNPTYGILRGVPRESGKFPFTVRIVDATGASAPMEATLTINR